MGNEAPASTQSQLRHIRGLSDRVAGRRNKNQTYQDLNEYKRYLKDLRDIASEQHTKMAEAEDFIKKGAEKREAEAVIGLYDNGVSIQIIAKSLNISENRVMQII